MAMGQCKPLFAFLPYCILAMYWTSDHQIPSLPTAIPTFIHGNNNSYTNCLKNHHRNGTCFFLFVATLPFYVRCNRGPATVEAKGSEAKGSQAIMNAIGQLRKFYFHLEYIKVFAIFICFVVHIYTYKWRKGVGWGVMPIPGNLIRCIYGTARGTRAVSILLPKFINRTCFSDVHCKFHSDAVSLYWVYIFIHIYIL